MPGVIMHVKKIVSDNPPMVGWLLTIKDASGCETRYALRPDAGIETIQHALDEHVKQSRAAAERN